MSKLKKLIEELCPDGVFFSRIDELCEISRGRVMSKDYIRDNAGDYPVYSSQTENNGELGKISTFDYDGEFISWTTDGANAGSVFYRDGKFSVTNVCGLLKASNDEMILKYIYYALLITAPKHVNKGMGNPKLMSNVMAKIKIPVPPTIVQKEIVNILDKLTPLTEALILNIKDELNSRKKQYEYYRDELFKADSNTNLVKLGEISEIFRGGNFQKTDFIDEGIPCIHYGQIYTMYGIYAHEVITKITVEAAKKAKYAIKNDIIMAVTSENVQDVCKAVAWLGEEEIAIGGHTAIIRHKQNAKYLSYYFSSSMFSKQKVKLAQGTKVLDVAPNKLSSIEIPLPSLEEQERIVNILDRFDKISTDISKGLSGEINARRKQYEFYRDKLLTFKKLEE